MTEEQQKHEDELKEFAKDHFEFSKGLKWHLNQLGAIPREAKKALKENLCQAHGFIFLEGPDLYVRVSKIGRLKELIAERKEKQT